MTKPNPEGKFISCTHNQLYDAVTVAGVKIVLCVDCYAALESQIITEFLRKEVRRGVESGFQLSNLLNKRTLQKGL